MDEILELASGDGEHASLWRLYPVSVRDASGRQQRLPSIGAALLIPNAVTNLALKHVEDFILVMVDVQGRRGFSLFSSTVQTSFSGSSVQLPFSTRRACPTT
jgi:hypothetical protein